MTKKELIEAMKDLDDDAEVYVQMPDDDVGYNIAYAGDKVTRPDLQNEITLFCK